MMMAWLNDDWISSGGGDESSMMMIKIMMSMETGIAGFTRFPSSGLDTAIWCLTLFDNDDDIEDIEDNDDDHDYDDEEDVCL